ncbi:MAG: hypothetical protein M1813_004462 [Trichoglossum hirsutum]|nr:MAG: hypothetical protein M1813_004462 [Trichoglossum hirsutum]
MPPPSPLAIATSSVVRLVKEERSYHKELQQQAVRIQKLAAGQDASVEEDNVEFLLKQERRALAETEAVFPTLRLRIEDAVAGLENLIEGGPQSGKEWSVEEVEKAKEAVVAARKSIREGAAV